MQFNQPVILASQSKRRKVLLKKIVSNFKIISPDISEKQPENINNSELPCFLAQKKALSVAQKSSQQSLIIAADTVVLWKDEILDKPASREQAIRILEKLSNNKHEVITGVCILAQDVIERFDVTTKVHFERLEKEEIAFYVDNFNPYDKAGAYGIQEWIGMVGVKKLEGCYYNVVGMPISALYQKLKHVLKKLN